MANDRTDQADIAAEMPEITGRVRPEPPYAKPFAQSLIPIIDKARQLAVDLGFRPYRVFLVHVQWPGGAIGRGYPVEISRREILPTPRVVDMSSTSMSLRAFGLTEEGAIVIDRISSKYSEDDLLGRTPDMIDPALPKKNLQSVEFFWEIVENRQVSPPPVPRRYIPGNVPVIARTMVQWKVSLLKQGQDRSRDLSFDRRSQ